MLAIPPLGIFFIESGKLSLCHVTEPEYYLAASSYFYCKNYFIQSVYFVNII